MNKFVMFTKLFFCDFGTFNFCRTMNGIYNHFFLLRSSREMFVSVCNGFFHKRIIAKNC